MEQVKQVDDHVGVRDEAFYKTTLFRSDGLLLGLNCLEPGQTQHAHDHADQDKFYYVVAGHGRFQLNDQFTTAGPGSVVWAAAGVVHGVTNTGTERLTLLVGIAPAP